MIAFAFIIIRKKPYGYFTVITQIYIVVIIKISLLSFYFLFYDELHNSGKYVKTRYRLSYLHTWVEEKGKWVSQLREFSFHRNYM